MKIIDFFKRFFNKSSKTNNKANMVENLKNLMAKYAYLKKNAIDIYISNELAKDQLSYFGGLPLVDKNFKWPYYESAVIDDEEIKLRPLNFLIQFNLEELAKYDENHLLPTHGILSFFYLIDGDTWGFDPSDKGSFKVFYFENINDLKEAKLPNDYNKDYLFPKTLINLSKIDSYPTYEDLPSDVDSDDYEPLLDSVIKDKNDTRLLGYSNNIQGSMPHECELIAKGYYLGGSYDKIPQKDIDDADKNAPNEWILLFQLDSTTRENIDLMFGDAGRIYFWIRKDDLKNKNFDNVWMILQCY